MMLELAAEWAVGSCLLELTVPYSFPGDFYWCHSTGNCCWSPLSLVSCGSLLVCSGVATPAPALRRRLELPGSLLHRCRFLSNIYYSFKHGRKVYFGFPKNVRAGFGLVFPVSSYLGVGDGSLFLFVFFSGILAPLLLWFSDSLHILCSCTPLVASSLLPGRAGSVSTWDCFQTSLWSEYLLPSLF